MARASPEGSEAPDASVSTKAKRLVATRRAIQALRNVLKNNPGTELLCRGQFKLLFSLLQYDEDADMQTLALEVLVLVTANRECVADIANAGVLVYLFFAMQTLPNGA
jgi:DnaJ homolog subfamily C member 13